MKIKQAGSCVSLHPAEFQGILIAPAYSYTLCFLLWLSNKEIASAQMNFPSQLHWSGCFVQGPIWYFCNSEYVAVVSALISCFLRYYENSSDMCSPPLLDPVPWSSSQFYFLQRLWILWIFQRFRFVFHKVRKAVARIVVHKGDQLLTSSFTHALQKLVLLWVDVDSFSLCC